MSPIPKASPSSPASLSDGARTPDGNHAVGTVAPDILSLLRDDAAAGLSQGQAGTKHGLTKNQVSGLSYRYRIKFLGIVPGGLPAGSRLSEAHRAAIKKAKEVRTQRITGEYRRCAEEGLTKAQTGRRLGVTHAAVGGAAKRYGIVFRAWNPASEKRNSGGTSPAASNHCTAEQHGLHAQTIGHGAIQCPGAIPSKTFGGAA